MTIIFSWLWLGGLRVGWCCTVTLHPQQIMAR
jgi:hypothetical protein